MTFTTLSAAGAKLRASEWSNGITELRPLSIQKGSDEIVSNSSTLQDDDELLLAVAASLSYQFFVDITMQAGTTADFKWALTFPTGATLTFVGPGWDTSLAFVPSGSGSYTSGSAITSGGAGIGSNRGIILRGTLNTGANAGNLRFQWAQNTPTVENTVVKAGSWMIARRLT